MLFRSTPAESLQFLTGRRFSSIPSVLKPTYKDKSNRVQVAYWRKGDTVSDMISSLLNTGEDKSGKWVDAEGNNVTILK